MRRGILLAVGLSVCLLCPSASAEDVCEGPVVSGSYLYASYVHARMQAGVRCGTVRVAPSQNAAVLLRPLLAASLSTRSRITHASPPLPRARTTTAQVELQLEAQDGSLVSTEYGVVGAFGAIPAANATHPVNLVAAAPLDACSPLAEPLKGAVAITRRGNCSFVAKYLAVLAAGGSAMLMFNDAPGVCFGGVGVLGRAVWVWRADA